MTTIRSLVVGVVLAVLAASSATAAPEIVIRKVDTSRLPAVRVTVTAPRANDGVAFAVLENDRAVAPAGLSVQRPSGATAVALVIDSSHTMRGEPARAALAARQRPGRSQNAALKLVTRSRSVTCS